jgi:hypothetical protein
MEAAFSTPIERGVPYIAGGTLEVAAEKKQDIEDGFQIVGDTVSRAMNKQLNRDERSSPLHGF